MSREVKPSCLAMNSLEWGIYFREEYLWVPDSLQLLLLHSHFPRSHVPAKHFFLGDTGKPLREGMLLLLHPSVRTFHPGKRLLEPGGCSRRFAPCRIFSHELLGAGFIHKWGSSSCRRQQTCQNASAGMQNVYRNVKANWTTLWNRSPSSVLDF